MKSFIPVLLRFTTDKASIDGEEGGKTPAAQQCGHEIHRTKVLELEEASCSLPACLNLLHKYFQISFSFRSYEALNSHFSHFWEAWNWSVIAVSGPWKSKTKKKLDEFKGEGDDIQVNYNLLAQELLYSYFQDDIVGLLAFYLPPRRLLTLCLY